MGHNQLSSNRLGYPAVSITYLVCESLRTGVGITSGKASYTREYRAERSLYDPEQAKIGRKLAWKRGKPS